MIALDILRGIIGMAVVIGVAYLFSSDRRRIDWKLIGGGLFLQVLFALAVLPIFGEGSLQLFSGEAVGVTHDKIHMTESPVLIKNYLPTMNRSEIFLVMVAGMATIAGSVMGTYVSLLGNGDPEAQLLFATHLLSASVMAVPGSIVVAKVMCPQTEPVHDAEGGEEAHSDSRNVLSVIASGTQTGVKLMVNIAAMLLVFIALVALLNYILSDLIGHYTGLNDLITQWTGGKATGLTFQFKFNSSGRVILSSEDFKYRGELFREFFLNSISLF